MKKAITILALAIATSAFVQQEIRLYEGVAPGSEGVQDNERISRGPDDPGNTSGTWRESFYRWLTFNHF